VINWLLLRLLLKRGVWRVVGLRLLQLLLLLLLVVAEVLLVLLGGKERLLVLAHNLLLLLLRTHIRRNVVALSLLLLLLGVVGGGRGGLLLHLVDSAAILPADLLRLHLLNYLLHVLTCVLELRKLLLKAHVERLE